MDIKSIKKLIEKDKMRDTNSYRRHPIRYVFMELNSNTQDDILYLMEGKECNFIDLSEQTKRKVDGWLTKGEVRRIIDGCSRDKDTYIVGFSEWLRFCSNQVLESFVLSLCDMENANQDTVAGKRRIYIICFSMKEHLYRVLQEKHHRFAVYNPFINDEIELRSDLKEIYFVTDSVIDLTNSNVIKESQEWLKLWKNAALLDLNKPVLCYSEILQEWYQKATPDNAFQIDIISSVPSYIEKIHGISIDFDYIEADNSNWKRLLEFVKQKEHQTISDVVKSVFGIKNIDSIGLYKKWIETNDGFEKWLIFNYVKHYLSYTFLARVFQMMKSFLSKEFQKCVWKLGFAELDEEMNIERKQILEELSKYKSFSVPEEFIRSNISKRMNEYALEFSIVVDDFTKLNVESIEFDNAEAKSRFVNRMKECFFGFFLDSFSGFSDIEKEIVISFVGNGIIEYEEVKDVYPNLYAYIGKNYYSDKDHDWITSYLKEYRISKLYNKDSNNLKEMVGKYNSTEDDFYTWYFSLEKQDVYIRNISQCPVYVLDGVGAEYIPYIDYLLKINNYKIKECKYAASSLPSITSVNSKKINKYHKWIKDFDKDVIHGEIYSSAHNIQKSLSVLERIIEDIIAEQMGGEFIITADHGATARARWTKPAKKYNYINADHEGRCCKANGVGIDKNQDYLVYEDGDQWIISLRDISLNNNPKYEDHGGASIEEVVVPFIYATSNAAEDKFVDYMVTPFKIAVDGLNKNVSFIISPKPDCVELFEQNGNRCEVEFVDDMWNACLTSGKQQTVRLRVDQKEFLFDVVSNASKIIKEDDGFDD